MKTNNTESESISNNDALNASLFESDSVYGGNNTIQESFWEESEQSVSGFNSSRISYKESEPTHHRESSHPKFAIKASKRIKVIVNFVLIFYYDKKWLSPMFDFALFSL